jgi:hypothetical protein
VGMLIVLLTLWVFVAVLFEKIEKLEDVVRDMKARVYHNDYK